MRVADEDRQLSAKELENLILARNREFLRWDNKATKEPLEDIDENKLKYFIERAGLVWDTVSNALEKLDLLADGRIFNAASLFFSKTPVL